MRRKIALQLLSLICFFKAPGFCEELEIKPLSNDNESTEEYDLSSNLEIDPTELFHTCNELLENSHFRMMRNALTQNNFKYIARNWDCNREDFFYFSHEIQPILPATNQKASGRCWIYAGLNAMRMDFVKRFKLNNFEFSQSYLFFFDKVEKANFFLERIIDTYETSLYDPYMVYLFCISADDGGYWHTFENLVKKYGLVPQSVFPESAACFDSRQLNTTLELYLSKGATQLRTLLKNGEDLKTVRAFKKEILKGIYQILTLHFGSPPTEFQWSYRNKKNNLKIHKNLTPQSFFKEFVKFSFDDYVTLVHSPRIDTPFYENYAIPYSSLMIGGKHFQALNLPMDKFKTFAMKSIENNYPIYFGCDVTKQLDLANGILDDTLYDLSGIYQLDFHIEKGEGLAHRAFLPVHAMLFTGLHKEDGEIKQWKVENSWGSNVCKDGFFRMSDSWFENYVFEIIVPKSVLDEESNALLEKPAIQLDILDPLFS